MYTASPERSVPSAHARAISLTAFRFADAHSPHVRRNSSVGANARA